MATNGFMIIPFPSSVAKEMIAHIRTFIGIATGSSDTNLANALAILSDDEFVKKFHKAFRMFPPKVANLLSNWVKGMAAFLGGTQSGINYVSLAERLINTNLQEKDWDVFWRCVRPAKPDVGSAHCDYQFWEIVKGTNEDPETPFKYNERWKIWIPLLGCNSQTSLQVVPGSHREAIPIDNIMTKNGLKPTIRPEWLAENESRFICPFESFSDCCVLFHDKLVHRGPQNPSKALRLSGELTIVLAV